MSVPLETPSQNRATPMQPQFAVTSDASNVNQSWDAEPRCCHQTFIPVLHWVDLLPLPCDLTAHSY